MTRIDKFAQAAEARARQPSRAETTPPPAAGGDTMMKTTVYLTRHTRAALTKTFADLTLANHLQVNVGQVGTTLYEMFLEDPDLQAKVIERLK